MLLLGTSAAGRKDGNRIDDAVGGLEPSASVYVHAPSEEGIRQSPSAESWRCKASS